jgi:hypothetical protein
MGFSFCADTIAVFRRSITARGVPRGASIPYQLVIS